MSLDVHLRMPGVSVIRRSSGIFIREGGQNREITREEWDRLRPGREPYVAPPRETSDEVFHANITHNLAPMAREAGVYDCCWRPDEYGLTHAKQLIEPLAAGIERMSAEPARFIALNPKNGWGTYSDFLPWLARYLAACEQYPEAEVSVCR